MNATLYTQVTNFNVPIIDQATLLLPRIMFEEIAIGDHFLRSAKDGHNQIFLKIGKRNALMLLDSKGRDSKVLKFKEENKVTPLDAELSLTVSGLTEMGKVEAARRIGNTQRTNALRPTLQTLQTQVLSAPGTAVFPYPPERSTMGTMQQSQLAGQSNEAGRIVMPG